MEAEREGLRVSHAPVAPDGRIRLEELARLLDDDVALVTVMHANNEIGTIQPIAEISRRGKRLGVGPDHKTASMKKGNRGTFP